jgi:hypothetical protein
MLKTTDTQTWDVRLSRGFAYGRRPRSDVRHVHAYAGALPIFKERGCGAGLLIGTEALPYQHETQKERSDWSQWGQSWCVRSLLCEYPLLGSELRKAALRAGQ